MYVYNIRNTEKCYEQYKTHISKSAEESVQ